MFEHIQKIGYASFQLACASLLVAVILTASQAFAQQDDDDLLFLPAILASIVEPFKPESNSDLCQGYLLNDTLNRPMTGALKPAPGKTYTDAAFGSRITRITNSNAISSGIIKTMYSTIQAWNADESRLILWHRGDGHHLYHGTSYQHFQKLPITPSDIEQVFWNSDNPETFFYPNSGAGQVVQTAVGTVTLQGNELIEYNVKTQLYKIIKDFNSFCPMSDITAGGDVQMTSASNNVFGLRCGQQGFSYTVSSDTITSLSVSANGFAPQAFPSGDLFYHEGNILNSSLSSVRALALGVDSEHSSLGKLPNGNDAYFAVAFDPSSSGNCQPGLGSLVAHDATSGDCKVLVGPVNGYPYTLSGTHPSALAFNNPGWVAVSSVGYGVEGDSLLEQELYLAYSDLSNSKVCRIAHHRSAGGRGSLGYFAEPHPVISPSGTRVLFSSDWNNSGKVDVYVVELPVH